MDTGLNTLLKWSIENSDRSTSSDGPDQSAPNPTNRLNEEALRSLLGGPSDAELMKQSMEVIENADASLDAKMIAFDNLEQLIESLDNANNMEPLGLWTPLVKQLQNPEADLRRMAAWCIGTAVQNNARAQERFLAVNGLSILCSVALDDTDRTVRKKAIYALSSEVRNYQPAFNEVVKHLPAEIIGHDDRVSASDMDAIDSIMSRLRERL